VHITAHPALQEMNFVLSDLALEVVGDAAIVWLLSPKALIAPRPTGGLGRLTMSLPGYFLQVVMATSGVQLISSSAACASV
jgi:hypothetical protein